MPVAAASSPTCLSALLADAKLAFQGGAVWGVMEHPHKGPVAAQGEVLTLGMWDHPWAAALLGDAVKEE